MFEATTPDGTPIAVRASFWQCMKAGIAFTIGAGMVTLIAAVLWTVFGLGIMFKVLSVLASR